MIGQKNMISNDQILNLSKTYQIDRFTIIREYLQLIFLSFLYQEKNANKFYFKGGTALRLLYASPRFSEDLDFSTKADSLEIDELLKKVELRMKSEFKGIEIVKIWQGKDGIRYRIHFSGLDLKFPLNLRLDFHQTKVIGDFQISTLKTNFPVLVFPQISHLSIDAILEEKIKALETRNKGRDIFDIWFLLMKGVNHREFSKIAIDNLKKFPEKKIESDLAVFLPKGQKNIIPLLIEEILKLL